MSEIKFRAWDIEAESYVELGFDFRVDGNGNVYRRAWGETVWDRTTNLILEQFTGLKDKHGKEIYEGDVVEFQPTNKPERAVIEFQIHCYNAGFYPSESANANHYWEVIGNIHQHPKLLEKEDV